MDQNRQIGNRTSSINGSSRRLSESNGVSSKIVDSEISAEEDITCKR